MNEIAILGAGAWGTALALVARRAGRKAVLWARSPQLAANIAASHANPDYLPGVALDPAITVTSDLAAAVATADAVLLVVPAQAVRAIAGNLGSLLRPGIPVVICAKGIEIATGALLSEVLRDVLPHTPPAVLSGPTFASEVARELPTAVTLAAADKSLGRALVAALGSRRFRPYFSVDVVGAEVGGALKNVLAIACGIVEGRGLGDNARAALLTRGLAEIARFATALGAAPETLMGLSGLGDIALSCNSDTSRNLSLGIALGAGHGLAAARAGRRTVEGVHTAPAALARARAAGVELPICAAVDAVLHHFADIDSVIEGLLARPFRREEAGE
jgi:glycerol-3-phosphate dehydrogenase (NAD(P)+)